MKAIIWAAVSTKEQASETKGSIQSQIAQARALCKERGWRVVDELIVPGFSRNYIDIHQFAGEAAASGIHAPRQLLHHFEVCDFDVLIVRDGDRFGRTQTLFSHVVETVIKELGCQVYTFSDGFITSENYRMFIAMGGYRAAGEIDGMLKKQQFGYRANIKQGIPMNASVARSHKVVRDPDNGKVVGVEVDESRRQEFLDAASLVLEGIAWQRIEREMYDRFGYAKDNGEPYAPFTYYRLFYTPSLWGHLSFKARNKMFAPWSREEGHPIPDGVTVNYHTHEPMFTGTLATQIKAELDRRESMKGKRKPHATGTFSGLVICGECGYALSYARMGNYTSMRCGSRYLYGTERASCTNRKYINEKTIIAQFKPILTDIIKRNGISAYLGDSDHDTTQATLATIAAQIDDARSQIETMIAKQAQASDTVQDIYEAQIQRAGERLTILQKRQLDLKQTHVVQTAHTHKQRQALTELKALGQTFWTLSDKRQNQCLHAIFGDYRLVWLGDDFQGIAKSPFA